MFNKRTHLTITVISLFALAALMAGLFFSVHIQKSNKKDLSQFHGTLLSKPRNIHHFELTGIDKKPFDNAQLHNKWTMIFFGFTNCGYLCPTTMAELGKMMRILQEKNVTIKPQVVMITVDPARDDLNKLAHYVHSFNPDFYGARGNKKSIKAMTRELGIAYAKIALKTPDGRDNYDIEHTGTVLLFNPEGQLSAFFTAPLKATQLADDYVLLTS